MFLPFSLLAVIMLCSCNQQRSATRGKPVLCVTIEPVRYFTEAVAGEYFDVISIVPKGASPESYDPTPKQLIDINHCQAYLRIGYIGFERAWCDRLLENSPHLKVYNLSENIDLIHEEEHDSHHESQSNYAEEETHSHVHVNGVEPHIWNSTVNARIIIDNILHSLTELDKEHTDYYTCRRDSLFKEIDHLDSLIISTLSQSAGTDAFMIYHPALSYFARDYGLLQIPIEEHGKEPSAASLKALVSKAKEEGVTTIFVQPEFDKHNAELVAAQVGARIATVNPLSYNWQEEMLHVAQELVQPTEHAEP